MLLAWDQTPSTEWLEQRAIEVDFFQGYNQEYYSGSCRESMLLRNMLWNLPNIFIFCIVNLQPNWLRSLMQFKLYVLNWVPDPKWYTVSTTSRMTEDYCYVLFCAELRGLARIAVDSLFCLQGISVKTSLWMSYPSPRLGLSAGSNY